MRTMDSEITHDLETVCERVRTDAAGFIEEEEDAYERQIEAAADRIAAVTHGCRPVLQSGPSSVGKTTTARRIQAALATRGVEAFVVSLDDFYLGHDKVPRLPDGSFDFESPDALDLEHLRRCMTELVTTGETFLPRYDFETGAPAKETTFLHIDGDAAVIFEGIHAFSPRLGAAPLDGHTRALRLFINTCSRFTDHEDVLLCRRDIRLSRRLLRDERTRNSDFKNTMSMWEKVLRGDEQYIFPYSGNADITVDTTMGYEPCVLAPMLLGKLSTLKGTAYEDMATRLMRAYERFEPLAASALPEDSVLREFIGHGVL